jgi:hypothetical protein
MTMTSRESLIEAIGLSTDSETVKRIEERGIAVADVDTMSQAIHDVYCGILADHQHPSEKDRQQARAMIEALQKVASGQYPA